MQGLFRYVPLQEARPPPVLFAFNYHINNALQLTFPSGWVHESCALQAAAAQQERHGTWAGAAKFPWQKCPTCSIPYTGVLKLALAREWCLRTDRLFPTDDTQRFAARTTLGNALSASGKIEEAIEVVKGNLKTITDRRGPEHPHTLGTLSLSLSLSVCLSQLTLTL